MPACSVTFELLGFLELVCTSLPFAVTFEPALVLELVVERLEPVLAALSEAVGVFLPLDVEVLFLLGLTLFEPDDDLEPPELLAPPLNPPRPPP